MDSSKSHTFGGLLRRYRLAARLTQEELAERAQVSPRAISDLERGQRSRPYRDTVRLLADALRLEPSERAQLETAARLARLPSPRVSGDVNGQVVPAPRHNLPFQPSSFVGRERELGAIKRVLTESHLLTLVGTGGCGKTRLALRAAADVLDDYPDGVWLVEFAPLTDTQLIPSVVAAVLGVREGSGKSIQTVLIATLQTRRLLLLLDNCEHLVEAVAQLVSAVLRTCPGVRVLATSREALSIAGEVIWPVPPLPLPATDAVSPDEVGAADAARLFVERARAVQPGFALTIANAPAAAQTCRQLDGIPLAIELAAARSKVLAPQELLARLGSQLQVLTGGARHLPVRHRTLRQAIAWSFDLLGEGERRLLRQLAVFVGGATLDAAEEICLPGDPNLLNLLTSLVDKHLVRREEPRADQSRYLMLETIREFAREKFAESGEESAVRQRHARYYLSLIEGNYPPSYWLGPRSTILFIAEAERENLRAALHWFAESGESQAGLLLAVRLSRLWHMRGPTQEGRDWLARFLAQTRTLAPSSLRAAGLLCATFLTEPDDAAAARVLGEEGLAVARQAGDAAGTARILERVGQVALRQGDESRARACFEEGLALARDAGDQGAMSSALIGLGDLALLRGDHTTATALYEESRTFRGNQTWALRRLCFAALHAGNADWARELIRQSLDGCRKVQSILGSTECLAAFAATDVVRGHAARAVRLFAAQAEGFRRIGGEATPADRAETGRFLAAARTALPEDAFLAAWAEGQAMTLEQAIAYALEQDGG
jgi:non-specific serine/threonine protein kinase